MTSYFARCLITLAVLLAVACDAYPQQTTLTIGTTAAPPLSLPDQSGRLDNMLREAFKRIGVRVAFVTLPSERSLSDADAGIIDGDSNRIAGLESTFTHLTRVPESNMDYEFMAFSTTHGIKLQGSESLNAYIVSYVIGWKILDQYVKTPEVYKVASPQQLFSLLKAGRTDIVLYDRFGGDYYLKELNIEQGYAIEPPLAHREMFLYLNSKHAALVPRLAEAIRAMKADGSYARFFAPER
jgi:polar amino acid transport system substrate-binding protein